MWFDVYVYISIKNKYSHKRSHKYTLTLDYDYTAGRFSICVKLVKFVRTFVMRIINVQNFITIVICVNFRVVVSRLIERAVQIQKLGEHLSNGIYGIFLKCFIRLRAEMCSTVERQRQKSFYVRRLKSCRNAHVSSALPNRGKNRHVHFRLRSKV